MPVVIVSNGTIKVVDGDGTAVGTDTNPFRTDPTGDTAQPISAESLPLPTDAATEETLGNIQTHTDNIPSDPAKESGKLTTIDTTLTAIKTTDGIKKITDALPTGTNTLGKIDQGAAGATAWKTDGSGVTQPVSATALPLPTGAATETTLAAIKNTDGVKKIVDALPVGDNRVGRVKVTDDTNVLGVDAQNHAYVAGKSAAGVAPSSNPVSVSGVDGGGLKRTLLTDTAGKLQIAVSSGGYAGQVEGRAADGATPVGNPVLIAGFDSTNVQALLTDTAGRLITAPAGTSSAQKGFADGRVVLAATAPAVIRSTTYTEQTANFQGSVASSSASDTAEGTGARKVKITYYDQTGAGPYTEDVTLNGTSYVNLANTNHCYIEKMEVLTVGSGATIPVGTITLKAGLAGAGTTVGTIAIGEGQAFWAHHYVPVGRVCNITGLHAGVKGADSGSFYLRAKPLLTPADAYEDQISDLLRVVGNSSFLRTYGTALQVTGPARITVWVVPDSTSSRTYYASFDFYEETT